MPYRVAAGSTKARVTTLPEIESAAVRVAHTPSMITMEILESLSAVIVPVVSPLATE